MNAEETWRVWRRILREPALAEAVITGRIADGGAEFALSRFGLIPEQYEIAAQYAEQGEGVRWAVEAYQFRLIRVTRYSVAEGAPLTAKALLQAGHDLPALAAAFVEADGWLDRGPYVYANTIAYVDYLEQFLSSHGHGENSSVLDVLRLERAGARLVANNADRAAGAVPPAQRGRWTGRGSVERIGFDVPAWLSDPQGTNLADVAEQPKAMMVYLDGSAAHYAFAAIGDGAARVAEAFRTGGDTAQAAAMLGIEPTDVGLRGLPDTFVGWGVLEGGHTAETDRFSSTAARTR
jgi:hypothetical protein